MNTTKPMTVSRNKFLEILIVNSTLTLTIQNKPNEYFTFGEAATLVLQWNVDMKYSYTPKHFEIKVKYWTQIWWVYKPKHCELSSNYFPNMMCRHVNLTNMKKCIQISVRRLVSLRDQFRFQISNWPISKSMHAIQ
jgi:hypothetical protein